MSEAPREVIIPALLRAARGAYAQEIRVRVARAGMDDLPRNAAFILGGMANRGAAADALVGELEPRAEPVLEELIERGYLERTADGWIQLTDRGRAAGAAVGAAVEAVDEELERRLTPAELAGLAAGLSALADIRAERREPPRP
jgi:hypothetical protein